MRVKYYNWLFDEIATRFGDHHLDRVVAHVGGTTLHVPKVPNERLLEAFPQPIADWLIAERGGEKILIGSRASVREKRERASRNYFIANSDLSASQLARITGLSIRSIELIKQSARER